MSEPTTDKARLAVAAFIAVADELRRDGVGHEIIMAAFGQAIIDQVVENGLAKRLGASRD